MKIRSRLLAILWTGLSAVQVGAADYSQFEKIDMPVNAAQLEKDKAVLQELKRDNFSAEAFQPAQGRPLPYRLLSPLSPQPGVRYPVVIVLHGSGAVGDDNISQLGAFALSWSAPGIRSRFPAYVLVPQFPERSANYSESAQDGLLASQPGASLGLVSQMLDDFIAQHPVDIRRIYLSGFSMGASAAWNLLLHSPGKFAASVAYSGIPPERSTALQLKEVPVLIVHGNADTENPIPPDRAMFAALQKAGAKHVYFREYEGMEHRVPADMLLDQRWREWLFAQSKVD